MKVIYYLIHGIMVLLFALVYHLVKDRWSLDFQDVIIGMGMVALFLLVDIQMQTDKEE